MNVEVKKIDSTKREINIEVGEDTVKSKFEDVFKRIAKDAKVPGFRPGHAPRDILEKHYSATAHEQVLRELIPDVYSEAITKEALDVIELPEISDVKLDRSRLSFKATVEITPEIPLKGYKNLAVHYKKINVSGDEIKRSIDALKESRKIDSVDEAFARILGYPNLPELEKALEAQIFIQKENQQRRNIENELLLNLTKDLDFKIPQGMIKRQLQDLLRHAKVDLAMKGLEREKIDAQENELIKSLEPEARRQAKVYLVLAAIAKKENIALDDNMSQRAVEFLFKEADWQEQQGEEAHPAA